MDIYSVNAVKARRRGSLTHWQFGQLIAADVQLLEAQQQAQRLGQLSDLIVGHIQEFQILEHIYVHRQLAQIVASQVDELECGYIQQPFGYCRYIVLFQVDLLEILIQEQVHGHIFKVQVAPVQYGLIHCEADRLHNFYTHLIETDVFLIVCLVWHHSNTCAYIHIFIYIHMYFYLV